mmetsp:Transcript_83263/g.239333  ORF Transcript_83263/g.239333 Transcript_83263/m.239333 type:complete len:405 (-) Transcript_83263:780-1994(-)
MKIEVRSMEADDRRICISPSSLHLDETFAPAWKSRQGIHNTIRAEERVPDHITLQAMPPSGTLNVIHHDNVAAVQEHIEDATFRTRRQADVGQILRQLPTTVDANRVARRDVQAAWQCCDLLAGTPGNLRHAPHQCHTAICNTHRIASAHMTDGDRLLASHLVYAADDARGGEAATACAGVVRGHVGCRGCRGYGPASRRRQRKEYLVSNLAERPEEGTTIGLQAWVHEIGADLQLVRAHQCTEVVLPPPIEAIFAVQCLGHSAVCVAHERQESAVDFPCCTALAQLLCRGLEASAKLRHGLPSLLSLIFGCAFDCRKTSSHGICPAECNDCIGSRCAVCKCGAHTASTAGRPGVSQNDLQIRLTRRVAIGVRRWQAERHNNLTRLPILQRPQTHGLAPTLVQL